MTALYSKERLKSLEAGECFDIPMDRAFNNAINGNNVLIGIEDS